VLGSGKGSLVGVTYFPVFLVECNKVPFSRNAMGVRQNATAPDRFLDLPEPSGGVILVGVSDLLVDNYIVL